MSESHVISRKANSDSAMNVLFCTPPWVRENSGLGSVIKNLATYLHNQGHRVLLFYQGETEFIERTSKWNFVAYRLNLRTPLITNNKIKSSIAFVVYFPLVIYQLCRFIKRNNIQIVNIHYVGEGFIYFAICRKILKSKFKLITSIHGSDIFPMEKVKSSYTFPIKFILRSSDQIVAPSRSFLEDTLKIFPSLLPKGNVIHNGIRIEEFERNGSPNVEHRPYLLCIAVHNEKKGIEFLIKAFQNIARINDKIDLLLVGDGPLRLRLESIAYETGLTQRIKFLGRRDRNEIAVLLRECEIFVLPSRAESFGIVLLEAMACKKPIVATAVGGITEIIQHKINGLLVPPENIGALSEALIFLLDHPDLRKQLGIQGYNFVIENFRYEKMGDQYQSMMVRLLN